MDWDLSIDEILVEPSCFSAKPPAFQPWSVSLCTTFQRHNLEFLRYSLCILLRLPEKVNSLSNYHAFCRIQLLRVTILRKIFPVSVLFYILTFLVNEYILSKTSNLADWKEARHKSQIYEDKPMLLNFISQWVYTGQGRGDKKISFSSINPLSTYNIWHYSSKI